MWLQPIYTQTQGLTVSLMTYMRDVRVVSYPKCFTLLYFSVRIDWLSLVGQPSACLFAFYTLPYKNFKNGFFKVIVEPPIKTLI